MSQGSWSLLRLAMESPCLGLRDVETCHSTLLVFDTPLINRTVAPTLQTVNFRITTSFTCKTSLTEGVALCFPCFRSSMGCNSFNIYSGNLPFFNPRNTHWQLWPTFSLIIRESLNGTSPKSTNPFHHVFFSTSYLKKIWSLFFK